MQRVLVTGATGNIGRQVVTQLLTTNAEVVAMTRHPERAHLPSGVSLVRGDLTDPDSLDDSLDGVDAVFLVWTVSGATASNVIEKISSHVRRLVLLSSPHQTPHPFFQQPNPMAALQARIEELIRASGIEWTFLRPGIFALNTIPWWAPQIRAGNVVRWPYAKAATAPTDERDIAAVAVRALLDEHFAQQDFVLTGPQSLTQEEQVLTIGEVLEKPLRFEELSPDEARHELGFPLPVLTMLLNAWEAAIGQPAYITNAIAEITGRPATSFRQWVSDHQTEFR